MKSIRTILSKGASAGLVLSGLLSSPRGLAQPVTMPAAYPSASGNYIRSYDAIEPVQSPTTLVSLSSTNVHLATAYFDGLGRPLQKVYWQASPLGNDMVIPYVYDSLGRQEYNYLSFTSNVAQSGDVTNNGNFKLDPFQEDSVFSSGQYPGESYYYGKVHFEASPLNRPVNTYAPGNNWVGSARGIGVQYFNNTLADSVVEWVISNTPGSLPTTDSTTIYPAGKLYKTITTDENNHQAVEYKDNEGRLILRKSQVAAMPSSGPTGWLNTYYVYDNVGNLRFVIPPLAVQWLVGNSWNFASSGGAQVATGLCFRYEYDDRDRTIIKKVPGTGEQWRIYDTRDRVVLAQDSNLRVQNNWLFTKFDQLNRPILTGFYNDGTHNSQSSMQSYLTAQNMAMYETYNPANYPEYSLNQSFPVVAFSSVLTVAYYDNYTWMGWYGYTSKDNSYDSYFAAPSSNYPYPQALTQSTQTKGLVTGLWESTGPGLLTGTYYDDHSRVIQTKYYNITGGIDITTTQYDFVGKPLQTYLRHQKLQNTTQTHTINTLLNYDAQERLKSIYKNIDNAAANQLIDSIQYNELAQMRAKYLGNKLDSLIYDYNIRDWTIGINKNYVAGTTNHYFGMELGYDKTSSVAPGNTYVTPEYNGNIEGVAWKTAGSGLNRKYDFTYDDVNRLTGGLFQQNTSGSSWDSSTVCFSTSGLSYDANGNILSMNQKGYLAGGSSLIDQLAYSYPAGSNQLGKVVDGANNPNSKLEDFHSPSANGGYNYGYDGNGNLRLDSNKSIGYIHYNYLNLPDSLAFTGKGYIKYQYDNAGLKLTKTIVDNMANKATAITYISGNVYQRSSTPPVGNAAVGGTDTLQFIPHEEGRVRWAYHVYTTVPPGYAYAYDFFEKDHLGNTRVVLTQEQDTANYIATMEYQYRGTELQLFGNIANTSAAWTSMPNESQNIPNNIRYLYTSPNDSVSKVDSSNGSGHTIGPNLLLKVMAGDTIMPSVQCYFVSNTLTTTNSSLNSVLVSLATGIMGTATGASEGSLSGYESTTGPVYGSINSFLTNKDTGRTVLFPKSYLNWILLDDQFNYVSASSGAVPTASSTYPANQMNLVAPGGPVVMSRNGYLYVWVSNETQGWDVFFDNFSVQYKQGRVLEENHYYPFGLTMAGISDKALKTNYTENKYRYNKGSELQNKEFSDGSGLEMYETEFRELDPQLGRWWQIDPMANETMSLYSAMENNPILNNDELGDTIGQMNFDQKNEFLDYLNTGINVDMKTTPYYLDKKGNLGVDTSKAKSLSAPQQAIVNQVKELIDAKKMFLVVKEDQESQIEGPDEVLIDDNGQRIPNPTFLQMGWTGETVQDNKDPHNFRLRVIIPGEGFYQGLKATDGSDLPNSPIWLSIYHEFGHAYYRYFKPSSNPGLNALQFENALRAIKGLKERGYDNNHHPK
jgi:RHS repeat-associated protein